jgi:Mlc titration factor MtfA (ptsG expression regulator)
MLFDWRKRDRRLQLLARPTPTGWFDILERNVAHHRYLDNSELQRLFDQLRIFVPEKNWEGCGGLQMTDEIKVTIAAQACLLTLGLDDDCYDHFSSILVYPHAYLAGKERIDRHGLILEVSDDDARLGEASYRGAVVLSWDTVLHDGRHPRHGGNLVYHEFAHQLDMLDGSVNGTPLLRDAAQRQRWHEVMTREFRRLRNAAQHGRATLLDQYGATNEGEFFAVATECFFDRPVELQARHAELYELLRDYYRQDPAARCHRAVTNP